MAGENRRRRLRALLDLAGVDHEGLDAVEAAFVHESAARESAGARPSNERLEFLGDAVLGMAAAAWLYAHYPDEREGTLAKRKAAIVADRALAQSARRLGFSDLVVLGAGMRNAGGAENTSILADAFEAFIAALFLQYGFEAARRFVEREHVAHLDHDAIVLADAKTRLQELTQERLGCAPVYREESRGPAHGRSFVSTVSVDGQTLGTGEGPSKKAAQQIAAARALDVLLTRHV